MEPISAIVTVLAMVGGAMLNTVMSEATKTAYSELKDYIFEKYQGTAIASLEQDPSSQARQLLVQEVLDEHGLNQDSKAADLAAVLMASAIEHDRKAMEIIGVDIERAKAVNIRLKDIVSRGTAVRLTDTEAIGDIEVTGATAGFQPETHRKN